MQKTVTLHLSLDELDYRQAMRVLSENGLTVDNLLTQILRRTAREGAVPLKKTVSRPRKRTVSANMPGLFVQGELFPLAPQDDLPDGDNNADRSVDPDTLNPTLPTIASLQEAQAMLNWRARERVSSATSRYANGKPIIETRQFRLDKVLIAQSPDKSRIIQTLEDILTVLSAGRTPPDALPLDNSQSWYLPLSVPTIPDGTLGLVYQTSDADICMARYGAPSELLHNPPPVTPN